MTFMGDPVKYTPLDVLIDTEVQAFEIHLGSDEAFVKRFGRRVKAAGGNYSACRGHSSDRYVHLPVTARVLANEIIEAGVFERWDTKAKVPVTVIMRGGLYDRTAPIVVSRGFTLEGVVERYRQAIENRVALGLDKSPSELRAKAEKAAQLRLKAAAIEADTSRSTLRLGSQEYELDPKVEAEVRSVLWKHIEKKEPTP